MPDKPEDEKRPRWLPEMLSEAEIEQLRRKAKEDSKYFRKAFAHLRPEKKDDK